MRAGRLLPLSVLLAALLLPALARSEEDGPRERWQHLGTEAVERLHVLAKWCASAKLFAARAEVYEAVLRFEPDDEIARRWLRYERADDGAWRRKPGYTAPRDRSRSRGRFEERRAAWSAWFSERVLALVEAARAGGDVALGSRILATATRVVPEVEVLRRENGEILLHSGDTTRWILVESKIARKRRRSLRKIANAAVAAVPDPTQGTLASGDDGDAVAWGKVLQGERVRVLGTPDEQEMRVQHEYCEACWPVFRAALDLDPPTWISLDHYARGLTVYVFDDLAAGNAFLGRQPHIRPRFHEFTKTLAALWIPYRAAVLVKCEDRLARLEGGPKQILGGMCAALLDLGGDEAWVCEGLDHYLTYLITGTRILSSVTDVKSRYGQPTPGLPDVRPRAMGQDDWLRRGLALLRSDEKPDFFLMVGKNVNDITVNEVLYGYCIVVYLIQGRPKACVPFFSAVGKAETVDLEPIVQKHLGFDVATFETRVLRWLDETISE